MPFQKFDLSTARPDPDPRVYVPPGPYRNLETTLMLSSIIGGTTGIVLAARYDVGLAKGVGYFVVGTALVAGISAIIDKFAEPKKGLESKVD